MKVFDGSKKHMKKRTGGQTFGLKLIYLELFVDNPTTIQDLKELSEEEDNPSQVMELFAQLKANNMLIEYPDGNYKIHEELIDLIDTLITFHVEKDLPFFETRSTSQRMGKVYWPRDLKNKFPQPNKHLPKADKNCESCEGIGYLEVTTEYGEESQWCQECVLIPPNYNPPPIE